MSILDRFGVPGTAAIVTGAGRGLGAATAVALAEAGSDVLISARTPEQLDEVADVGAAHIGELARIAGLEQLDEILFPKDSSLSAYP